MSQLSIDENFDKISMVGFTSILGKARGSENYFHRLPFAGSFRCIDFGGDAFKSFRVTRIIPALIESAQITRTKFLSAKAIKNLNFITAHKIDTRI